MTHVLLFQRVTLDRYVLLLLVAGPVQHRWVPLPP
jgi:general stress protein CsbA